MRGHIPMHMAGISKELLQRDCICPLIQAHLQADMALVTMAKQAKKKAIFFMCYLVWA